MRRSLTFGTISLILKIHKKMNLRNPIFRGKKPLAVLVLSLLLSSNLTQAQTDSDAPPSVYQLLRPLCNSSLEYQKDLPWQEAKSRYHQTISSMFSGAVAGLEDYRTRQFFTAAKTYLGVSDSQPPPPSDEMKVAYKELQSIQAWQRQANPDSAYSPYCKNPESSNHPNDFSSYCFSEAVLNEYCAYQLFLRQKLTEIKNQSQITQNTTQELFSDRNQQASDIEAELNIAEKKLHWIILSYGKLWAYSEQVIWQNIIVSLLEQLQVIWHYVRDPLTVMKAKFANTQIQE